MYEPKYKISDVMLLEISELEQSKSKLDLAEFPAQTSKELLKKSKAVNMFHLAHMIGVDLTIKDAEKAVEGKKITTNDARGLILNNFRSALEFVRSDVTKSQLEPDVNMLLHMNKILITEWKEVWEAKLRLDSNDVDSSMDGWVQIRDKSITMFELESKLNEILFWFKTSQGRVHNLIRIGVLFLELVKLAPFSHLNQVTIIALIDLLLFKYGYLTQTFLPIVRELDQHNQENIKIWQKIIEEGDMSSWLERFILNLKGAIKEDKDKILGLVNTSKNTSKQPFLDLNRRQLKILRYLQTIPTVKREDYVQMMDVSTMTAFRDLTDLVEKKLLRVEGRGRGTKYLLLNR